MGQRSDRAGTLLGLFAQRWPRDPDAVLAQVPDGPTLTYGQARRGSARVAGVLDHLGVGRGDRVAAVVATSPEVLVLHLACLRRGAALVPLNPALTDDEVARVVDEAEPAVVVVDPGRPTHRPDPAARPG